MLRLDDCLLGEKAVDGLVGVVLKGWVGQIGEDVRLVDRGTLERVGRALKPVFEVASLADALALVEHAGGSVTDFTFQIDGSTRHDVVDPDGNVLQLRD